MRTEYPLDRAVEISKMRRLMNYGLAEYREDWELAIALAMLMASGNKNYFHPMLDDCFRRISAFSANNEGILPFDYDPKAEGAFDDISALCKELS